MTTAHDDELRDTCQKIQAATGIDDRSWKVLYGNDEGLYGFIKARELAARKEGKLEAESKTVQDIHRGQTRDNSHDAKVRIEAAEYFKKYMISTSPFISKVIDPFIEEQKTFLKSQQQENEDVRE